MMAKLPSFVLLTLSALFWGGNFVVGRMAHGDILPLSLTFWRWGVAALILFPFVGVDLWRHRIQIKEHIGLLVVLALTGMVLFHAFAYIALSSTTAINASFVLASMPMVIPLISLMVGDEKLNARQGLGIFISILGVSVVVVHGQLDVLLNLEFTPGDLWILSAVLAWSIYSVLLKRKPNSLPPMVLLTACIYIAVLILTPFYIWELMTQGGFAVTVSNGLVIGYVAIFASIVAFICWNTGVARIGANKAGLYIHLIPLFASALSIAFLGESLQPYHYAAIGPIVLGIFLTTTAKVKRA